MYKPFKHPSNLPSQITVRERVKSLDTGVILFPFIGGVGGIKLELVTCSKRFTREGGSAWE